MPARFRAPCLLLLAVLVLVVTGCRTDVQVGVDVREDGSGTVTITVALDAAAAAQLGDPSTVALADLRTAGWRVDEPARVGGGLRFRASRSFSSPAQLSAVLDEVGGAGGVFRGVRLTVEGGFASTSYGFRSGLSLTGEPEQFGDADLTKLLGGLPLGRTPEELALGGATSAGAGTLVVSVHLPGDRPDASGAVRGGRAVWRCPLTGRARRRPTAARSRWWARGWRCCSPPPSWPWSASSAPAAGRPNRSPGVSHRPRRVRPWHAPGRSSGA